MGIVSSCRVQRIDTQQKQCWEHERAVIEIEPTHLVIKPFCQPATRYPLRGINGVMVYRDNRLGFYMQNEDVVDVLVSPVAKWEIAKAVSRRCAF